MDPLVVVICIVVAFLGGLALGWTLGGKPVKDATETADTLRITLDGVRDERDVAKTELATAIEKASQIDELKARTKTVEDARYQIGLELASIKSQNEEREASYVREREQWLESEEKLQSKFNEIGEKILSGAQEKLREHTKTQLESLNKESLEQLEKKVGPVGETLERYRKRVEELEKNRSDDFSKLQGVISKVQDGQEKVLEGANRISTTLKGATKARGDWGEIQFENLLESCGLRERTDIDFQSTVDGKAGKIRPDAVINIPGGRKLVVDVKNVFNTYARANEAESEEQRTELLRGHVRELKTQIDDLAKKRYQDYVEGSAEFVVMFIPGEHVLYTALSHDNKLLDYALRQNIVLSSPLNFMSIALTVATIWRQAGEQADANEIAELGKELYDRLGTVAKHLASVRKSLYSTNQHFDSLIGSFDKNLRKTGERFEQLSVDTSAKDLADTIPLNSEPRKLSNFSNDEMTDNLIEDDRQIKGQAAE